MTRATFRILFQRKPLALTFVLPALCFIFMNCSGEREAPFSSAPLTTGFYVWQEEWSSSVAEALDRAKEEADGYWVFAGHLNRDWGPQAFAAHPPKWENLANLQKPVTLVYRIFNSPGRSLSAEVFETLRPIVLEPIQAMIAQATIQGVSVAGVQIDYDCPTAKLAAFRGWLEKARESFAGMEFSITALPTWLSSRDFRSVAEQVDYYVLQVHSFQNPTDGKTIRPLFDAKRFPAYLKTAGRLGVPFLLSLPTYGYRLFLDSEGNIQGMSAEGPRPVLREGFTDRTVMADAKDLAEVVRTLSERHPTNCLGILWFRLPVEGDRLNWSWPALSAVMQGREPGLSLEAEVKIVEPELLEVWIQNTGEQSPAGDAIVEMEIDDAEILACDAMGEYRRSESSQLVGPAPRPGQSILAAWYRLKPEAEGRGEPVRVKSIEVKP